MDITLSSLTLDGGYTVAFSPAVMTYTVLLPCGRPEIPHVTADAPDGYTVRVMQAVIPDGKTEGKAYIDLSDGKGKTLTYTVTFRKTAEKGFVLQYADVYPFRPRKTAPGMTFESSDPAVLTVDGEGVVTANALSSSPVTVYAMDGETVLDSLTVDKVIKAPVDLFLIVGQSNAAGIYDIPQGREYGEFAEEQKKDTLRPGKGQAFCLDVNDLGDIPAEGIYDLSRGRSGFSPALCKKWYELTGEKCLVMQTAVGGAPIEAWMKPDGEHRYTYYNVRSNFYETTANGYRYLREMLEKPDCPFTLNRTHAYWLQGETGMSNTYDPDLDHSGIGGWRFGDRTGLLSAEEYYDKFLLNMKYFREEFGVRFMGILLVRATGDVISEESRRLQKYTELTAPRAAQYALHNTGKGEIALVSRVCDIACSLTADPADPGYGMMGCEQIHYNQTGHNANGLAAAGHTYALLCDREVRKATGLEVIACDGRKRFADGETLCLTPGETYQLSSAVLPLSADRPEISYTTDDTTVAEIDRFGTLRAKEDAAGRETVLTVAAAAGFIRKIRITVGEKAT